MNLTSGKPFNPIIGETFQATVGDTQCYSEQTSHHPPITNYLFINPKIKGWGYIMQEASVSGNTLNMRFEGSKSYMELYDGTKYQLFLPKMFVMGLMFGNRYINFCDVIKIVDMVI